MWRLLLGTMGVKSLVQGLNAAATAGFEPRDVWSEVRRRNRLATAPPLDWRWIHTFRWKKRCTFRNGAHSSHCQMAWLTGDRSSKANDRISGFTVLLSRRKKSKNESKLIPKTIGIDYRNAEAFPILCVRYIRWERERYRERKTEVTSPLSR